MTEVHHVNGEGEDAGVVYCEMQARENTGESLTHLAMLRAMYPGQCGYRSETGGIMANLRHSTSHHKVSRGESGGGGEGGERGGLVPVFCGCVSRSVCRSACLCLYVSLSVSVLAFCGCVSRSAFVCVCQSICVCMSVGL